MIPDQQINKSVSKHPKKDPGDIEKERTNLVDCG